MNDRTRFAKCFIIIVEQCKSWLVDFAENQVKSCSSYTTLEQFINSNRALSTDPTIRQYLQKMKTSLDLNITALRSIIICGNLLHSGEMRTTFHEGKTIGDYIDRIREMYNNIIHTASANLDEQDYNDYLAEFRHIASRFESENKVSPGCYIKGIDKINENILDSEPVKKTVKRYNMYIQIIIQTDLLESPTIKGICSSDQTVRIYHQSPLATTEPGALIEVRKIKPTNKSA